MSCSKINVACDALDLIGRLGGSVSNSVFSSIASSFGNTADSAINWLWRQLSSSTSVSLSGANFELDLGIVLSIAVVICLGLFVIQITTSALRRDVGGVARALHGLVIASVGCAITLATLNVLLAGVDQLCVGIVKVATGGTIASLGSKIIGGAVFTTAFASAPTVLILSLVAIVAVAIVWFALVIRKMLILITAIFAPMAFAGGVADFSRGWIRKWLEAMLALVFSKLILIIIFVIGLGVLGGMGSPKGSGPLTSITGEITGLLILLVAGFSPWMALRLVHFTGDHAATLAQSATHARAGASTVVGAPQKMAQVKYSAASLASGRAGPSAPRPNASVGSTRWEPPSHASSPESRATGGEDHGASPPSAPDAGGVRGYGHSPASDSALGSVSREGAATTGPDRPAAERPVDSSRSGSRVASTGESTQRTPDTEHPTASMSPSRDRGTPPHDFSISPTSKAPERPIYPDANSE